MIIAAQPESLSASDYIRIVMDKTKNNRTLALVIFKKLFDELPQQLICIEDSLKAGHYENAREMTHKMHGSVSFCGLTDIQEPAKKLEQCLINENYQAITPDLLLLRERVFKFTRFQDTILAGFNQIA